MQCHVDIFIINKCYYLVNVAVKTLLLHSTKICLMFKVHQGQTKKSRKNTCKNDASTSDMTYN